MADRVFVGAPAKGLLESKGGPLRSSLIIERLHDQGHSDSANRISELRDRVGRLCAIHGRLDDPIIALLGEDIAFACPWCSDPEVLKQWEAEGEG